MFTDDLIIEILLSLMLKNFENLFSIWQRYEP